VLPGHARGAESGEFRWRMLCRRVQHGRRRSRSLGRKRQRLHDLLESAASRYWLEGHPPAIVEGRAHDAAATALATAAAVATAAVRAARCATATATVSATATEPAATSTTRAAPVATYYTSITSFSTCCW